MTTTEQHDDPVRADPTSAPADEPTTNRVGLSLVALLFGVALTARTPIVDINYDAGETVGWPRFAATVGGAYDRLPAPTQQHAIVLTENYGEAGAVARYRPDLPVYGTQNSLADLGAPGAGTSTAVVVGYPRSSLSRWFGQVQRVATIANSVGVDNDEQGAAVWLCRGPRAPWTVLWPRLRHLG